jgi:hypothetical protein
MIQATRDPRTGVFVVTDAPAREVARRTAPHRPAARPTVQPAPAAARATVRYSPKAGQSPLVTHRATTVPPPAARPPRNLARHWPRYAPAGAFVAAVGVLVWLAYLIVSAVTATAAWAAAHGPAILGGLLLLLGLLLAIAGRSCHTTVTVKHHHRGW